MLGDWLLKPHNILLVAINSILIYHILGKYYPSVPAFKDTRDYSPESEPHPSSCPAKDTTETEYRDYVLEELAKFDGIQNEKILVAMDMRVFDVTKSRNLYGPGGTYAAFAGRDASKSLATGKLYKYPKGEIQEYDYLTDLSPTERDRLNEWIDYYDRKYPMVGTLLPFHLPDNYYSEDESGATKGGGFLPED